MSECNCPEGGEVVVNRSCPIHGEEAMPEKWATPTEPPEDLREQIKDLLRKGDSLKFLYDEQATAILRLCEAAALAALEKSRADGMFIEWNGLNLFDIATAQANIHSVFGGAK